jgi:radical SAM superfamily enzyme YgiQ (UPF0313 family)
MTNRFVFATMPMIETLYPLPAYAALRPVISKAGYICEFFDFNLKLKQHCTSEQFDEINSWCMYVTSAIRPSTRLRMCEIWDQYFDDRDLAWLGISVFSFYSARPTTLILDHVRQRHPNRHYKILLGGNGCMASLREYDMQEFGVWALKKQHCEHVVFGEGELALAALLDDRTDYAGVDCTNHEQIKNLDALDFADYTGVNWNEYYDPRVLITGSRGCVRKCTFCDIEVTWPKYSYRSAENLIEEMRRIVHEHGLTRFEFTDSLINGNVRNFNRFNELLIESKAQDPAMESVTYMGQFICRNQNTLNDSSYELMHYAGCNQITVGIESFSERVRYHMKKKFSDADIDNHFRLCSRWGIPNVLLLIVGYPTETLADHQQNIRALHRYKKYSDMGIIFMARWGLTMHLYDDTPISYMKHELGISTIDLGNRDSVYNWISAANPELTLSERLRRRLEIHEISVNLGYAMPHSRKELTTLLEIAQEMHKMPLLSNKRTFPIATVS